MIFRDHHLTGQLHFINSVDITLGDIDGDIDRLFIRADRHLGRLHGELQVTPIQVPGLQSLQVCGEFLPGVLVIAAQPGEPAGGFLLKGFQQLLFTEFVITDNIDMADPGHIALVDIDIDRNPVARQLFHLGFNQCTVTALGNILALKLLGHTLEDHLAENLSLGEAIITQGGHQLFSLNRLVTVENNLGHRRTLGKGNNQHPVFPGHNNVGEVTGAEQ